MTQPRDVVADYLIHHALACARERVQHLLHRDALLIGHLLLQRSSILLTHIGHRDHECILHVVIYAVLLRDGHGLPFPLDRLLGGFAIIRIIFHHFDLFVIAIHSHKLVRIAATEQRVDLVLRPLACHMGLYDFLRSQTITRRILRNDLFALKSERPAADILSLKRNIRHVVRVFSLSKMWQSALIMILIACMESAA